MRAHSKHRLLLVCGIVLAATVVLVSQASATGRVRGTGSYGQLQGSNLGATPSIIGNAASFLSDADYDCQYGGTNCPLDLTDPNTSAPCAKAPSVSSLTGASPCNDLIITINPGTTFNPGTSLSITIAGFSDPTDQFGLFTCPTDTNSEQDFNGFCVPVPDSPAPLPSNVAACEAALQSQSPSSGGQVDIPVACLFGGASFYFDETTDNKSVSATYATGTVPAPEPNSFLLLGAGLASMLLLSKRTRT